MKRQRCAVPNKISCSDEDGQSIVLIAFIMVGIIAFVGLATDAGLLFARSSQWSAAVDAAALAGVVDMHIGIPEAEDRAVQFLAANGWENPTDAYGSKVLNEYGIPEFAFTATIPVDTFFLKVIGFGDINLTHSATAALYSLNEMPLLTQENRGQLKEGSQFIFGADACSSDGDPVSPRLSAVGVGNSYREVSDAKYVYRILVPDDYVANTSQTVRVQLFDPDPHNNLLAGDTVARFNADGTLYTEFKSCTLAPLDFSRSCTLDTGDPPEQNPVWLVRVDEIYKDDSCTGMKTAEPQSNTITKWRLYFKDDEQDEHTIASYTSNTAPFAATDLKWVTPGVTPSVDTDNNGRTFEVNIQDPLGDGSETIPLDEFNNYSIFLEVTAPNGTSKNTWDIWAGPPGVADAFNVDVDGDGEINANDRNLRLMQNYALGSTKGVKVYAVGRQPFSPYDFGAAKLSLPVSTVSSADAGLELYVSAFDIDGATTGDLHFWFEVFGQPFDQAVVPPDQPPSCDGGTDCNNRWINPAITVTVPINPNPDDPIFAFHGGNFVVDYDPGQVEPDEHVWSTLITRGTPFLTD